MSPRRNGRPLIDTEKLAEALYALGWSTVKKLPEGASVRLGRRIADIAWKRRGKGVLRLESNLARVVPDATPQRLAELSRAGMRSYMRYWMESFRLPAWSKDRIRAGFTPEDVHYLEDGLKSGRGVILALPHMGNYDLAGAWVTTKLGVPFTTVAQRLKPETLYDRFVAFREGLGMEVLPHEGGAAFGTLARRLRAGGLVCLVADRDLSASGIPVKFFGEATKMPAAPPPSPSRPAPCCCPSPSGTTTPPSCAAGSTRRSRSPRPAPAPSRPPR